MVRQDIRFVVLLFLFLVSCISVEAILGFQKNQEYDNYMPTTPQGGIDHGQLLSSQRAKSNKVGFMLSSIHNISKKRTFRGSNSGNYQLDSSMGPEEMLVNLCPRSLGLCERFVRRSFRKNDRTIQNIAEDIMRTPNVDPRTLFKFKLYEAGAGKIIENGYDTKLDSAINFVATKNPYLYATIKPVDKILQHRYSFG